MTREEFIKVLDEKGYTYKIVGDKLAVNGFNVNLRFLTTLPVGVKFENGGDVNLNSLTTLPDDEKFENGGNVYLYYLTTIPAGVKFENKGDVYLGALVGDWFGEWKGNIKGIASKRLLNLMISKGIFER